MKNGISKQIGFSLLLLFITVMPGAAGAQTPGDVNGNGAVDIIDALMIAQYSVGLDTPGFFENAADVNEDGAVNIVDALVVAQYAVDLISTLPPELPSSPPPPTTFPGITPPVYTGPPPTPGVRVDCPFADATWYTNPLWAEKAAAGGGEAIAGYNTAIWLEGVYSITSGYGIRGHLNAALNQGAGLITFVIYNLPNRDCWAPHGSGDFYISLDGMKQYKTEFIDPIAGMFADPLYAGLRIVCIIEPKSLSSLLTGPDNERCREAAGDDGYIEGIQYLLDRLGTIPNVYKYMDIAHSGWLGGDTNLEPMCDLLYATVYGTNNGLSGIDGIASNIACYTPLEEPFLPDPDLEIGGAPVKSADFYEWNAYFGEIEFALEMRNQLIHRGFPESLGIIIDTSRNGWGGPDRPTTISTSSDPNTYVDDSRIDRRVHRGNWCNQAGGLGERPRAEPALYIDAYIWGKAPGESDGVSFIDHTEPIEWYHIFDNMCDPQGQSLYAPDYGTGATDAPQWGRWNQAQFETLMQNAWPPL